MEKAELTDYVIGSLEKAKETTGFIAVSAPEYSAAVKHLNEMKNFYNRPELRKACLNDFRQKYLAENSNPDIDYEGWVQFLDDSRHNFKFGMAVMGGMFGLGVVVSIFSAPVFMIPAAIFGLDAIHCYYLSKKRDKDLVQAKAEKEKKEKFESVTNDSLEEVLLGNEEEIRKFL